MKTWIYATPAGKGFKECDQLTYGFFQIKSILYIIYHLVRLLVELIDPDRGVDTPQGGDSRGYINHHLRRSSVLKLKT